MVKIATAFTAAAAVLAASVEAAYCTNGLTYCGRILLQIGNYRDDIHMALFRAGQSESTDNVRFSLFRCRENGAISWVRRCPNTFCADGGHGVC